MSGARAPAVRAAAVRDSLANLDAFEAGLRARVLAMVPAASREVIEATLRTGWVSVEHDHHTVDAIVRILGRERAVEYWRCSLVQLIDRPLLRSFVSGMIAAVGRSPATVVGFFVRGWPLAYRDMCMPNLTQVDGQPAIAFDHVAPEVRRYPHYYLSWEGACRGFGHIAQVAGDVRFERASDGGSALAVFSWQ